MRNRNSGFTLLELMIALTILGIGFSAVFAGISQSARNLEKLERVQRRERSVQNLLAKLDLVERPAAGDSARGAFDDGTRWRMEIQPFILPTPQNSDAVVRIDLRFEWDGAPGIQSRNIETYRRTRIAPGAAPRTLQDQLDALR
jgi:prepilin-type N-terminal cleavage/methylation domain-containing protein